MKTNVQKLIKVWPMTIALLFVSAVITPAQQEGDKLIPFETMASYHYSGVTEKKNLVITNKREWKKLWKLVHSREVPRPPLPKINFAERMVIAVFLGEQSDSARRISIVKLVKSGDQLRIFTKETLGNATCPGPPVTVQPYHIVVTDRIETTGENVIFEEPEQEIVKCG